jgi:hypothetical protein
VWPEIPRKLYKTLEMLSQRGIPNSDYSVEDLEGLLKSLIVNQRRPGRPIEMDGGWSLVDKDTGMPGGVIMDLVLFPTYMILSLMTLFWYRYPGKAKRLKGFQKALHNGMNIASLHRNFTGFGIALKVLRILEMGDVFRYVVEHVNEHPGCRAFLNVLVEGKKTIDERYYCLLNVNPYYGVSKDIPLLHRSLAILPNKTSWKSSDHFTWRDQCSENSNCVVIVEAPYPTPPKAEVNTDTIANELILTQDAACILGRYSRKHCPYTTYRNASYSVIVSEYRGALVEILEDAEAVDSAGKAKKKILHLVIRALADRHGVDVEISTRNGRSCSENTSDWFLKTFEKILDCKSGPWRPFNAQKDQLFSGGSPYLEMNRNGEASDKSFAGFGENYNAMEIRMSRSTRKVYIDRIIDAMGELIENYRDRWSYIG